MQHQISNYEDQFVLVGHRVDQGWHGNRCHGNPRGKRTFHTGVNHVGGGFQVLVLGR